MSNLTWTLVKAPGAHLALGILLLALALCTVTDLRSRRIPNTVVFSAAACGMLLHAMTGGAWLFLSSLVAFVVWFIGGFLVWQTGGVGAGDIKMVMATGALLGTWPALWAYFVSNLLMVVYLFVRWLVSGTAIENFRLLGRWLLSIVTPGTKKIHFQPVGMEDRTPHAPFMLAGVAAAFYLYRSGVIP